MPVDAESLTALSDLTRRVGPPGPVRPRGPLSGRLVALGVGSVLAGLVCGLVLPTTAEAGTALSRSARPVPSAAGPTPSRVGEIPFARTSVSPFAVAVPVTLAPKPRPAKVRATKPRPAKVGSSQVRHATAPSPAAMRPRTADPLPPRGARQTALWAWARAYHPTRPLPAHSGTGRRIVYTERGAHLWVVGSAGQVLRDYAVTGRIGRPRPAVYRVYSKSPTAYNPGERLRFDLMVRFAYGITGARIGFHTIPRYPSGVPIQSESQLGRAIGMGGCVRQSRKDAVWLYGWSRVGDTVVVLR